MNNFTVYDVDLINSPHFHLVFEGGNGFTVWGVRIKTPANARNTDGIDPDSATNVTINDSYIQDGDDGIAIKTNSGAAAEHDRSRTATSTARTASRSAARPRTA